MKKTTFCLLAFATILFFGCSSESDNGDSEKEKNANGSSGNTTEKIEIYPTEQANFYAHYRGTFNSTIPIHMNLIKFGNKVSGYYYYDKYQIPIRMSDGQLDEPTGKFSFIEYTPTQERSGSVSAKFEGNKITGFWFDADSSQKFPIELTQSMDAYSVPMDVFHEESIFELIKGKKDSPNITYIQTELMPSASYSGSEKEQLYQTFESFLGDDTTVVKGNPYATIEKLRNASVKDYRDSNTELYKENPEMFSATMNWSQVSHSYIMYNEEDLLSVRQEGYTYSGGAHGNYGALNHAIDLKTGKKIKLQDIFKKENYKEITKIIKQKILDQQVKFIGEGKSLADAGFFVEEIKPTDNFYLTKKGIGFYYSPYEIAPYVIGSVEVFIPFTDLKSYVKNEFM